MIDIDDFKKEVSCEYKGETYSVRDNGAIMRHPKKGCRVRSLDNQWTFGKKNKTNGYMFFASNIRVHQVVATAFWGHEKEDGMVVDHKDTNRCNNRAENLHWVTKLENVLNNPITRSRIIKKCGSIEAFLENPVLLQDSTEDPNFAWMRTVSEEEAAKCKANLERWSKEDVVYPKQSKIGLGDWIFRDVSVARQGDEIRQNLTQILKHENSVALNNEPNYWDEETVSMLSKSLTSNAMQENWNTPTEFPLCPSESMSLDAYYLSLEKGKVFCSNMYGKGVIIEAAISDNKKTICVVTNNPNSSKKWFVTYIYVSDNKYIHRSGGSFFSEIGALKEITFFQGKEWTGEDCIDDYCD